MPTFQDLAVQNPNIRQQYDAWRAQRSQNAQDASNWADFRSHVIHVGGPDPGETEPDDFVGDDYKAAHPERYGQQQA